MKKINTIISFLLINYCLCAQSVDYLTIKNYYDKLDTIQYLSKIKNMARNEKDEYIKEQKNEIIEKIDKENPVFVLRIDIDTSKILTDNYLKFDFCDEKFDIYFFNIRGYRSKCIFIECTNSNSYISEFTDAFNTFEKSYAKNLRYAYRKIMKTNPTYLLSCPHLSNTLLFGKNGKIYAYRVNQKKVYELDEYINKFRHSKYFYYKMN